MNKKILCLVLLGACAKAPTLETYRDANGDSFTVARVTGSSIADCESVDADGDGIGDGVAWGYDGDSDGYAVTPTSLTNIYVDGNYLCVVSGGDPFDYVKMTDDSKIGEDCADNDIAVNPVATEICDGIDNDCDGGTDDTGGGTVWYADADSDSYGGTTTSTACAQPSGYVAVAGDCDDSSFVINPAASESCNSVDDDCDGVVDDGVGSTWYADTDADGWGDTASSTLSCGIPTGYAGVDGDCDDGDYLTFPGAAEVESTLVCMTDADYDGYGDEFPVTGVTAGTDCNDALTAVNPAATEVTGDAVDNDCDPTTLDATTTTIDVDGDGYPVTTDCDDTDATVYPGATEVSDGIDNDCDGVVDEGTATAVVPCTAAPTGYGRWDAYVSGEGWHCNYFSTTGSSIDWAYGMNTTETACVVASWAPTQSGGATFIWEGDVDGDGVDEVGCNWVYSS